MRINLMVRLSSALRLARLFLSLDALMSRCNLWLLCESSFSSGSFIFCFRSLCPSIYLPVSLHTSAMHVHCSCGLVATDGWKVFRIS